MIEERTQGTQRPPASPVDEVVLYAEFTAKAEHVGEVESLILDYAESVRAEPGNVVFNVYRRAEDSLQFVVFEVYRDQEAFAAHLGAAAGKTFNAQVRDLIEGDGSELSFLTRVEADVE